MSVHTKTKPTHFTFGKCLKSNNDIAEKWSVVKEKCLSLTRLFVDWNVNKCFVMISASISRIHFRSRVHTPFASCTKRLFTLSTVVLSLPFIAPLLLPTLIPRVVQIPLQVINFERVYSQDKKKQKKCKLDQNKRRGECFFSIFIDYVSHHFEIFRFFVQIGNYFRFDERSESDNVAFHWFLMIHVRRTLMMVK